NNNNNNNNNSNNNNNNVNTMNIHNNKTNTNTNANTTITTSGNSIIINVNTANSSATTNNSVNNNQNAISKKDYDMLEDSRKHKKFDEDQLDEYDDGMSDGDNTLAISRAKRKAQQVKRVNYKLQSDDDLTTAERLMKNTVDNYGASEEFAFLCFFFWFFCFYFEYDPVDDSENGDSNNYFGTKKKRQRMNDVERQQQLQNYFKDCSDNFRQDLTNIVYKEPSKELKKLRKEYVQLEIDKIIWRKSLKDAVTGLDDYEYYVLWKGLSHLHCEWVSQKTIEQDPNGAKKLKNFLKKNPLFWDGRSDVFDPSYIEVDRLLAARPGPGYFDGDTRFEYLVKFSGLHYSNSRWEFPDDFSDDKAIHAFQNRNVLPPNAWTPKFRPRPTAWQPLPEEENHFKNGNVLHPWQVEGVNWLTFNWYNHRGSILADEMGLGKTVQVVATLKKIAEVYTRGPFLVVAPLGTIPHWQREFDTWTDLNPVIYQGTKEDRRVCHFFEFRYFDRTGRRLVHNNAPYKFNVLITTYESVMLDEELSEINWKVCVVDEAHRLKNADSKLNRFLSRCSIEHKILLTGTPIQNNMRELWNLLNFVAPNNFDNFELFNKSFGQEKLESERDIAELHKVIRPYFLRRMKEDVAKFIPQKKETILEVELTRIQKQYYRAILEKNREFLNKGTLSSKEIPSPMNIAMQLRKVCNHPYLIEGVFEKATINCKETRDFLNKLIETSGKFVLLDKLLPKLRDGGHRVLIFSQMRMTLDLLDDYLKLKKYAFERIDGAIRGNERQAAIDRFSAADSDAFAFILTTKAGGVGLNLMAADTVIIFDSDWNPQNDIQAMARCHRLGQDKHVKVYRLITARSYEKEMFIKASKKLGLGKAIMGAMASELNSFLSGGYVSIKNININIIIYIYIIMLTDQKQKATAEEINGWLKHGAYDVFRDDDTQADKFCAADIDQILEERATDIVFDEGTGESTFSKATFVSSDAAAGVDINDRDFWEKILPAELNPQEMLEQLNKGDFGSVGQVERFWARLEEQALEVIDLRQRGELSKHVNVIISLLTEVANNAQWFSEAQRVQAQEWAEFIENPRRFLRKKKEKKDKPDPYSYLDEDEANRPKTNVFGNSVWSKLLCEAVFDAFFTVFATAIGGNDFWPTVLVHIKLKKKRSLREICGWCIACLQHLSEKTIDIEDRKVFAKVKKNVQKDVPSSFSDDMQYSDEDSDEEYKPSHQRVKQINPKTVQPSDFPSFEEPFFPSIVSNHSGRWAKVFRLALKLRKQLKDIPMADIHDKVEVPDKVLGELPTPWWTKDEDRALIIGAAKHGVGNWEAIQIDEELPFTKKCLEAARSEIQLITIFF
ncbi:myb domain-containing protein, partial [Reticulomyxa filosa]